MATRRLFLAARVAERDAGRLAGRCRRPGRRRPDRGRRSRRPRCRPTPPTTHEVHDLGDVSLLPGFVETHVHMHYPSPLDYREIARPEPVERMLIRATAQHAPPAAVRARRPRATRAAATTSRWRSGRRSATASPPGRACWSPGRRSPPPPATTGSSAPRPTRPTRSSGGSASAGRLGVDCVKIIASGGGYTPTSNPRSQQYGLETLRAAVDEAHRLGLPVLAHSLTAVSNRICVEAGVDTIIHGGVWWTEYPVRDRRLRLRPGASPTRIAANAGSGSTRRSARSSSIASTTTPGCPTSPSSSTGRCPTCPASSSRASSSCATWPTAASGSSAGWGWACRSSTFDSVACSAQVYARLLGFDPWRAIATITADAAEALGLAGDDRRHPARAGGRPRRRRRRPDRGPVRAAARPRRHPGRPAGRPRRPRPGLSAARLGRGARGTPRSPRPTDGSSRFSGSSRRIPASASWSPTITIGSRRRERAGRPRRRSGRRRPRRRTTIVIGTGRPSAWAGSDRAVRPGIRAELGGQPLGERRPAAPFGGLVVVGVAPQRDEQADDLLLAGLHRAPDAVLRGPRQDARLEQRAAGPGGRQDVHVLLLEPDRDEQVGPTGQEPRRLRPADRLAAAERDEVGAGVDEPAQVRRAAAGSSTHRRGPAGRGRGRSPRTRRSAGRAPRLAVEEGAGRRRADRGPSSASAVRARRVAELDEPRAGRADEVVVGLRCARWTTISRRPVARVGEALHPVGVEPGQHRRGPERQRRGRAGRDVAGLGPGQLGDQLAGGVLQVADPDERARPPRTSRRRPRAPSACRRPASRCRARSRRS